MLWYHKLIIDTKGYVNMKKWITQLEITKIIDTYSIRKDEFEPVSNINYCYQSKLIKGYMITLSEEQNNIEKTGRIIVTHTRDNGKRTYIDVWEHDKNNNLCFLLRNLWNQPLSDAEYIKDLEHQIEKLKQAGRKLQDQLQENQKLIFDTYRPIQQQEQQKPKHNERGAGRKPSPERLNAIEQMQALLKSGMSEQDIMNKLGISRATFYRYKKSINN